jgi:16S rRNA processing protein RimM
MPYVRFSPDNILLVNSLGNFKVDKVTITKNKVLCKFKDFDDVDKVKSLVGKEVFINTDDRSDEFNYDYTKENIWHLSTLLGFMVLDKKGDKLGVIDNIDLSTIQHKIIFSNHIVPFVKDIVPVVNVEKKFIVVDLPEGLLDLQYEN